MMDDQLILLFHLGGLLYVFLTAEAVSIIFGWQGEFSPCTLSSGCLPPFDFVLY